MEEINEMLIRDKNEKIESQSDNEITLGSKILRDVKGLMEEGVFQVFLQPKVNIRTGKTVGAESLIRLIDKEKGIVGPIHFISIFEKYNIENEEGILLIYYIKIKKILHCNEKIMIILYTYPVMFV